MKYKLTDNTKTIAGVTVYQIEAIKDFGSVREGDLGGWLEREHNLSQEGNCWVSENAIVYGNAVVYGNAEVYGNALVYGYAWVSENAIVYGNARVSENAEVYGNAVVSESHRLLEGHCITNLSKNIKESIRCQTGLGVFNDEVIIYKQVRKDLRSFYDEKFVYKVGEMVEADNLEISNESCARGLHGSNMNHWNNSESIENSTFLAIKVQLEDVITVQEGKIRFKKGLVLGTYNIEL
jgi:hypothetical protein